MIRLPAIVKRIGEGEMLPPFYGVAWAEVYSRRIVCLPVPLNLAAALFRATWLFCLHGWRPMHFNPRDAYHQGRVDALAALEKGKETT